jgi:hypothetical protein
VKEEHIDIDSYPFSGDQSYFKFCFERLVPKYNTWVAQVAASGGDKSACASNFLFKILPYLVTTVLQDGIYFIQEFPEHEFSKLLVSEIHEYTRFAVFQRQKVVETVERYQQEKVNQLDLLGNNVCTVVGALQREVAETNIELIRHREMISQQVISMQQNMINLQTSFIRQNETLERISLIQQQLTNSIATMNTRQEEISRMIEEIRNNNNNYNTNANIGTNVIRNDNVVVNENNNTVNVNVVIPTALVNHDNNVEDATLIQNQRNRRPRINGVYGLQGVPRVPPMEAIFPESWLAVLEEWNLHHLSSFVGYGRRHHFKVKDSSRFSKRMRAINQLKRAAIARGQSLVDIAQQFDGERHFRMQQAIAHRNGPRRFTCANHLEELERNDPTIRRRGNPQDN